MLPAERMATLIRKQGDACARLGSPLYAGLMAHAAIDVLEGGPVAVALEGHELDPGDYAVTLRLFGAVHGLVLSGRAPDLAPYYPSVGGTADPDAAWPEFRLVCAEQLDVIRPWLESPPQTNEIGRSAALLGGLLYVAEATRLPVRLMELGASAGLNLRPDLLRVTWDAPVPGSYGPDSSPVVLAHAWTGALPPVGVSLAVIDRGGCDLDPVVATISEGRLRLQAYVWPDQVARMERLRGALELARQVPATVVRADAVSFLETLAPQPGSTLVIWHSVVWQYLPDDARLRVQAEFDRIGAEATRSSPVAHLSLELDPGSDDAHVKLRLWPAPAFPAYAADTPIGAGAPHGIPVRWF